MIRVLIGDDHRAVAEGFAALLRLSNAIEVVGVAFGGEQALELARQHHPDVIILDVEMPFCDGLETANGIREHCGDAPIIFVSMYANPEFVLRAIALGARGYLLKSAPAEELLAAILSVAAGEMVFSREVRRIALAMGCPLRGPRLGADKILSERERAVVRCLAKGATLSQTATRLKISLGTVRTLWGRAQSKLDLRSLPAGRYTVIRESD